MDNPITLEITTVANLTAIQSIDEAIRKISDPVVKRVGSKLQPVQDGEKTIGTIQDMTTKRLYCIQTPLRAEATSLMAQSTSALTDAEEKILEERSYRISRLTELAKVMFWTQVQNEMNCWSDDVYIRTDWMLVVGKPRHAHPLAQILRIDQE